VLWPGFVNHYEEAGQEQWHHEGSPQETSGRMWDWMALRRDLKNCARTSLAGLCDTTVHCRAVETVMIKHQAGGWICAVRAAFEAIEQAEGPSTLPRRRLQPEDTATRFDVSAVSEPGECRDPSLAGLRVAKACASDRVGGVVSASYTHISKSARCGAPCTLRVVLSI